METKASKLMAMRPLAVTVYASILRPISPNTHFTAETDKLFNDI